MLKAPSWKFLLPIILVALLLRVNGIQHYGLWGDEQASMQVATGQRYVEDTISTYTNLQLRSTDRFSGVIRSTINDNGNSVLYNVALHYWIGVFGRSDLAARSLSLLFGICLILVAFRFTEVLTGSLSAAYLAAAFLAFHPLVVGYAQEARAYSMALLFSLLSSLFLLEGMSRKVGWAKFFYLYLATLIVALLSHYLVVYVLGAQLIVVAIGLREKRKWMLLCGGLLVVLVVIGLWFRVGGVQGLQVLRDQNQMHRLQAEAYRSGDPPYALPVDP
ncbi:MAG: glycosyltransferase family 39 protein, partial [Flavobacteriales bacterium]